MRHRTAEIVWTLCLLLSAAAPAQSGPHYGAKILIHLLPAVGNGSICSSPTAAPPCSGIMTEGGTSTAEAPRYYFACVLVTDGDRTAGISGVQFGVRYAAAVSKGVDVLGWTSCGTHEDPSPDWPADSTGILITWDKGNYQSHEPGGPGTGVTALVGYFYCAAYSPDYLSISGKPGDDVARVRDSAGMWDIIDSPTCSFVPSHLGYAAFSSDAMSPGFNPCGSPSVSPVRGDTAEVCYPEGDQFSTPPAHWPFQLSVSENKGLVIDGELYTQGDVITIDYDRANRVVKVNGREYLDLRMRPPVSTIRYSASDAWLATLYRRFHADKKGTGRERLARALASMPDSLLDPTFEPRIFDHGVELKFKGGPIEMSLDFTEPSRVTNPEREARLAMKHLIDWLGRDARPVLEIRRASSSR